MDTLTYPKEVLKIFETRPKLKKGLVSKNNKLYIAHINKGEKKNYKFVSNSGINSINGFTLKCSLNILFPMSAFEDIYADSVDCYVSYIKEPDKERSLSLNNSIGKKFVSAFIAQAGRASAFQAEGQGFKSP